MSKQETNVAVTESQVELAKKLNERVVSVLGNDTLQGFEKAYQIANAIADLKELLTPTYMKPIMALQGNKLGFKTDKDTTGGYPEEVVKNCLIEAVLTGVNPFNNQFNIIKGNAYITKEGFWELLRKIPGLRYDIVFDLPRISADKNSAAVTAKVSWTLNGEKNEKEVPIPVKTDQYGTADSVLGKATRKARAWLFNTITGVEIGDGDVQDVDFKVVPSKPEPITKEAKEEERILLMLGDCKSLSALRELEKICTTEATKEAFIAKRNELMEKP